MASDTVHDAIRDYLAGNTPAWTATPIAFENEIADSAGNVVPPSPPVPWVAVLLEGWSYGQQSIGAPTQAANRWDEEGVLSLDVLVPFGEGATRGRQYAKQLADLFRGTRLLSGSLEFLDTYILRGQPSGNDGNWWVIPVKVEWRRIEA
jgi:hypothetical protein